MVESMKGKDTEKKENTSIAYYKKKLFETPYLNSNFLKRELKPETKSHFKSISNSYLNLKSFENNCKQTISPAKDSTTQETKQVGLSSESK